MSDWKIVKALTEKVRNQIKNPSVETNTTNWTASGGTLTRSSEQSYEGAYSGKFVAGASSVNVKSNGVNVANGGSISGSLVTYRATSSPSGSVTLYDATNATARATSNITATADWELHELTWTNDTGGQVSVELRLNNTTADSAGTIYFDAAILTMTDYNLLWFDGDTPGARWVGTPHGSVSDMPAFNVYGGRQYDLEDDYEFKVTGAPGAGNAPVITNFLPYAIAPGGSYQNSAIGVRDWALTGWIQSSNYAGWQAARRTLIQELSANRFGTGGDPVMLRYTGGGQTRQIFAYYNGGLETPTPQYRTENIAPRFISTKPFFRSPNLKATVINTETSATMQLIIAKIDGLWDVLGPPNASGTYTDIYAICSASDGKIYVGGNFVNFDNQANGDYIAYYDKITESWGVVSALNGIVYSIVEESDGTIYFGGAFTDAGGVAAADYIAQWDGASVTAVGTPLTGAASITNVRAMIFDGQGRLWIGGTFTDWNNNTSADNIVYWDGTSYYAASSGCNNSVLALDYDAISDRIVIGGVFTSAGAVSNTARICAFSWPDAGFVAYGTGISTGQVNAVTVDATGGIYAGGTFTDWDGTDCSGVAYWSGASAQSLGTGVDTLVQVNTIAIAPSGDVWLGGQFTTANGVTLIDRMVVWNGSLFYSPEVDLPNSTDVNAIVFDGDDVYIGSGATGTAKYSQQTTVTNNGTEPSNPIFKFKRSGGTTATLVWIENTTTRKKFIADYSLLSGEEIVIDLRPGKKRFNSNIKGRESSTINIASDTSDFYLIPGNNVLTCYITTSGSPTVSGQVSFDELFSSFD